MNDSRTDQPAPHAGEQPKGAGLDEPATRPGVPVTSGDAPLEAESPLATDPERPAADAQPLTPPPTPDELEREGFPKPR